MIKFTLVVNGHFGQGPGYGVHLNAIENIEGELEVDRLERKLLEI